MSPKQKAVLLTDLIILQRMAMEKNVYHENEAARYRKQYGRITTRIMQFHVEENKKALTSKKRSAKLKE